MITPENVEIILTACATGLVGFLLDGLRDFMNDVKARDKSYMINVWESRVVHSKNLIDELHNNYIASFVKYQDYITTHSQIDKKVFSELLGEINKDAILSEEQRIRIRSISAELNLDKVVNKKVRRFLQAYKEYMLSIYAYIEMKNESILMIKNAHFDPYANVQYNKIRREFKKELKRTYTDIRYARQKERMKERMLMVIKNYICNLNMKKRVIESSYLKLENIVNKL